MVLSRRTVAVIVTLVIAALSGLVVIQVALLNTAFDQEEQTFAGNVRSTLSRVAQQLLAREAIRTVLSMDSTRFGQTVGTTIVAGPPAPGLCLPDNMTMYPRSRCDSLMPPIPRVRISDNVLYYSVPSPQRITIRAIDSAGGAKRVYMDTFQLPGEYQLAVPAADSSNNLGKFLCVFDSDSASTTIEVGSDSLAGILDQRLDACSTQVFITAVISHLMKGGGQPIEQRLDPAVLDSLIAAGLQESGIDLDYAYGVLTRSDDSLHLATPAQYADELRLSDLSAPLFPHDILASEADIRMYFPGRRVFLLQQIGPLLIPTAILMAILVGCFVYTIRTILAQRRFSGLVVDFINNMTHEFKTPISTVQLAADAIKRPDVVTDPEKVLRFNRMIQDETQRMRNQTDKILQMAVLEQGDYELKISDVDVHQVIAKAVGALALRVENRHGKVSCDLKATQFTLKADAVHFAGVIENLLDNANKYSPHEPRIAVATENVDGGLRIGISDNGIGMKPEHQKMVFEKYFRVPSGNIHDVKGFGLGLSYVRLIVLAHGGTVTLASTYGVGTKVDLLFPSETLVRERQL
jgi:signal transduction histidine kinase